MKKDSFMSSDRSFIFFRYSFLLFSFLFAFAFASCGTPKPEPQKGKEWSTMTRDDRLFFMGTKVYPTLKALFEKHDPPRYKGVDAEKFPKFKCENCHGPEPKKRDYKMPNPNLLPLNPNDLPGKDSKSAHFKKYGVFMRNTVLPKIKELLASVKHPKAKEFFCFNCHTKAAEPKEQPKKEPAPEPTVDSGTPEPTVDSGTPEPNIDSGTPEPTPEPPAGKSFKNDILPLFTKYGCTPGCHGGSGGMTLKSSGAYKNLVDVPSTTKSGIKRVTRDDAKKSMLYLKVAAKVNGTQPPGGSPMPLNGKVLSTKDLATLKAWIDEGAKDN